MRASPRKFTQKKEEDVTLNTEQARPGETGGLPSHRVGIFFKLLLLGATRVPNTLVFYQWSGPNLWGFIHCGK